MLVSMSAAASIDIIDRAERAAAVLQPLRGRILEALAEPASASTLARKLGEPRQKIHYHLRELEKHGFVELVEQRYRGNCRERIVRAAAASYVISPDVMGGLGETPAEARDRFSSAYLIAVCAEVIRDVAELRRRAEGVGKPLPTLTLQADVRFRSAAERNAFAEELSRAVAAIAAKYHDEAASTSQQTPASCGRRGRLYRVVVGTHPVITKTQQQARDEAIAARGDKEQTHA